MIFSRIQRIFNLPVFYKKTNVGSKCTPADVVTVCRWIVSTLGGWSGTQQRLGSLFQCLESYFHAANVGRHSQKLSEFLATLVSTFLRRLHRYVQD